MALIACNGATLFCNRGAKPTQLTASPSKLQLSGKGAATINDFKTGANVKPFGVCMITQKPCVPALAPWSALAPSVFTTAPLLTQGATTTCGIGGQVTVRSAGQSTVFAGSTASGTASVGEGGFFGIDGILDGPGIGASIVGSSDSIGPQISGSAFAIGAEASAGPAGIGAVVSPSASAGLGYNDGSIGGEVGISLAEAEANVGPVSAGVGLDLELGISLGDNNEIKVGPFEIGLDL